MRILKSYLLLSLILVGVASLFVTFPIVPVKGEVPWKNQGPEWYYDNLNASQRQKIRIAIDYCVPREQIIERLHLGYATAIASPIGVNFKGVYEPSIAARKYNLTKAKELLIEVFRYEYDPNVNRTDEISKRTNEPYFNITLVTPTTSTARSQWATWISYSLNQVGIDTIIKWWNWDHFMPRLFLDPIGIGYDYKHGGYDMVNHFHGRDTSPDPQYKDFYDKEAFPPKDNFYWIEDGPPTSGKWTSQPYPNITALWTDIYSTLDPNERSPMLKEYQQWCYDHVPTVTIQQEQRLWFLTTNLQGFDLFHDIQQQISNWTIGSQTACTIAHAGDYVDFNPHISSRPVSSSSYKIDASIYSNTHVALTRRRGEYNLSHAYPWLAENWTISDDYKTYTVNLRQGNKWSDGSNITADDVVFTYHAILNSTTASSNHEKVVSILGNTTGVDGTFSAVQNGANEYQVIFTLPEIYPYVETVLFNLEILQKAQLEPIEFNNWKTHGTNIGTVPLIASGPYMMHQYNALNIVELSVNPHYNETLMGHNPSAIGGGNWIPDPRTTGHILNVTFELVKSANTAVTGLIADTYDIYDSLTRYISAYAQEVNDSANATILVGYEWRHHEIALNHYNPVFGMNPHDPREMYPPPPPDPWYLTLPHWFYGITILSVSISTIVLLKWKRRK